MLSATDSTLKTIIEDDQEDFFFVMDTNNGIVIEINPATAAQPSVCGGLTYLVEYTPNGDETGFITHTPSDDPLVKDKLTVNTIGMVA